MRILSLFDADLNSCLACSDAHLCSIVVSLINVYVLKI
jgi:hypothetical protein